MLLELLKKYFGYESFRKGQLEIIDAILEGRDSMTVMPAGSGKSVCYQIPALIFPGITLVISPLIAFMQEQVKILGKAGIKAAYINNSLSESQISRALINARNGLYKIIYVAPERLKSKDFAYFAAYVDISMVTVNEAHCISHRGQDFRPSYFEIVDFIASLKYRPVISAFSSTATPEVKEDIIRTLHLQDPFTIVSGFDRPNLYFEVDRGVPKTKFVQNYIEDHPNDSGIIYCSTGKIVEQLHEKLFDAGIQSTFYHSGLSTSERKSNQDDFLYDRKPVMIATNAFGAEIDKSDVRFVIHYNMPRSIENYYQEACRAGRDGKEAQCIILFSTQDMSINQILIDNKEHHGTSKKEKESIYISDYQKLDLMEQYCRHTGCLKRYLLNYFGEDTSDNCSKCANCSRVPREIDMTFETRAILNCVYELRGRYKKRIVLAVLSGNRRELYSELGLHRCKTYGILQETSKPILVRLIDQLIEQGYLHQTNGKYNTIRLGKKSKTFIGSKKKFLLKIYNDSENNSKTRLTRSSVLTPAGQESSDTKKRRRRKTDFILTEEVAANFEFAESYSAGQMRDILNSLIDTDRMKKISATAIERLLFNEHIIEEREAPNGVTMKFPTKRGEELGIRLEKRISELGTEYHILRYPEEVQRLIIVLLLRDTKI